MEKLAKAHYRPTGSKVLVQPIKISETDRGILVPDTAAPDSVESVTAYVVAAGPDCKEVKRGMKIISPEAMGCWKLTYARETLFMLEEKNIAGIFPDKDAHPDARKELAKEQEETIARFHRQNQQASEKN